MSEAGRPRKSATASRKKGRRHRQIDGGEHGQPFGESGPTRWRNQHHPLDEGVPALRRTRIEIEDEADGSSRAYPMRAGDVVEALERKGRIDHRAAAGAKKFETLFQRASLQGVVVRDLRTPPAPFRLGSAEPHNILEARDAVWQAVEALGGIGTPGANIAWDVLGLGMTIKSHAERCQFGNGRSLNPMTATGILVQTCFSLAAHFGT